MSDRVFVAWLRWFFTVVMAVAIAGITSALPAAATPFTMTTPGPDNISLPSGYPEAGGVAFVMVGANGNIYYQFSDPTGAFVGFQNSGNPAAFRGNPFTINNPVVMDCGIRTCSDYFGGSIARIYTRFSAYDGDTQVGGFDHNDISLILNGTNVGNWSNVTTDITNNAGTTSSGQVQGFGNNTFNTGWFTTTDPGLLANILATGQTTTQVLDADPNDNYWDFTRGNSLANPLIRTVAPGYELEKKARTAPNLSAPEVTSFAAVGETIFYTYKVTNIGSVNISNLAVTDDKISGITCDKTTILESTGGGTADFATCTGSYIITQADFDAQSVTNVASATGTPEFGSLGNVSDTVTITGPALNPSVQLAKTASPSPFGPVGSAVTYTFTLTNDGNTTLTNLVVTDPKIPGLVCNVAELKPLSSENAVNTATCMGTYTVTQADIDAAAAGTPLTNTASVTGNVPGGGTVADTATLNTPGPAGAPAMSIAKSITAGNPFAAVGDTVSYDYVVTNTGTVTLTAPISVNDDKIATVNCPGLPPGGIAPLGTLTCTGSYTITQADLDAGSVTNTAAAQTTSNGVSVASAPDSATATATQSPALAVDKHIKAGSATTFAVVGDTITFEYTVSNPGNVTFVDNITITDDKIPGTLICSTVALAPGGSVTCEQTWTATQADLDAGSVTNTAIAESVFGGSSVTSPPDQVTTNAIQTPSLAMSKSIVAPLPASFNTGEVLNYEYLVTNDGNVSIDGPITVSDNMTPVSCPPVPGGSLAPLATLTCTASYTITANDIALGSTTNVASASGSFGGNPVTSPTDSAIFPIAASPALSIAKDSVPAATSFAAAGDTIQYNFTVTNTGNAAFSENIVVNDNKLGVPLICFNTNGGTTPFGVGAVANCSGTYTVTQADVDAGSVTNEATAATTFAPASSNPIPVVSPAATKTVNAVTSPALTVDKAVTAGPNPADAGDTLTYTITATNSGNQTISGVTVSDPLLTSMTCTVGGAPAPANVILAPTEALICTGAYVVKQSDVDAQSLSNTATATGADPGGATISGTDSVSHPLVVPAPAVTTTKAVTTPAAGNAFSGPGQLITFTVTVTNSGNVTLTSTTVTDDLVPGSCSIGPLAPGASDASCTFTYQTTQADVDAGQVVNTATAVSQPANPGAATVSDNGSVTGNGPVASRSFSISKTADLASFTTAGQSIVYTYVVTNTGNVTLHDQPQVTDDKIGTFACGTIGAGLAPADTLTCTASYTVTQADVDSGGVTNTATVTSLETPVSPVDSVTVPSVRNPGLSISKSAMPTANVNAGDTITYTYSVQNTGNVVLTAVTPNDQHSSAAGTVTLPISGDSLTTDSGTPGDSTDAGANGVWDTLGPGDVVTFSASYLVTQADVDAGNPISNTVTVSAGSPPGTIPPSDTDTQSVTPVVPTPSIEVIKTVSAQTGSGVGDTVTFQITAHNTGNVSISSVSISDTLKRNDLTVVSPAPSPVYQSGDGGVAGVMEVGETWVYSVNYSFTQADIDAGGINNSATVSGQAPDGSPVSDISDNGTGSGGTPTTVLIAPAPALDAVKTITSAASGVGDTVSFQIAVTNTGNVTLGSVGIASDTLTRADGSLLALGTGPTFVSADAGSAAGTLKPGETAFYQASYVLTQADIDAGGIVNTATATGTPPAGLPITDVTDDSDDGDGNSTDDPTELSIAAAPAMTMVKALAAGSGPSYNAVGDVLNYEFTVTNTGNVTLTNPISITDPLITDAGGTITCPAPPLAPTASMVCTGSYTVTQADLDAGAITNTATAGDGTTTTPSSGITVPAVQSPALETAKVARPLAAADYIVGAVVTYDYTVTNTGNVTITDPISISDNLIPAANITCDPFPAAGIAPGGTYACVGTYTVTANDVLLASVTNLATATDGTTTSPQTSETVPQSGTPALSIAKIATAGQNFTAVGDTITYQYTVTNSGTVAFATPVVVTDDKIAGPITCFDPAGPAGPDFIAGEVVTCTATYTVTQADLDAGQVTNQATAGTTFAGVTPVTSPPATETVNAATQPELTVTKSAATLPIASVGQVLTYSIAVENTGNQTITAVNVTDPLLPGLACQSPSLAPGDVLNCSDTYTVQQSDVDAGTLVNTVAANGITPSGGAVTGTDTLTLATPAAAPAVQISKTAAPTPFGPVGSAVTYSFAVQNTGNVTLSNLTVTDPIDPAYSCAIATIAPGSTDSSCNLSLTISQAQVDAGSITNTASVVGSDPFGTPVADSDTITTAGPARVPGLEATKTATTPTGTAVGSLVNYLLTVENTGNVTLNGVTISDTITDGSGAPTTLDAPFALVSGDTDGDGLLDVGESWQYQASHTLVQADINAGGVINTATVGATGPDGTPVSDVSDDGDDGDGNTTDDPTVTSIPIAPSLTATKTVTTAGPYAAGDTVAFLIVTTNTGNVDIDNITLADTMTRADGTALTPDSIARVLPAPLDNGDNTLQVGEVLQWTVSYTLLQVDIDAGGIANTVTVSGTDPGGNPVSDVSDDGDPTDGNTADDPTELVIAPAPTLDVVKTVTTPATAVGDTLVFLISAENTGNVTLGGVTLTDTLTRLGGGALTPDSVTALGADPATITVGETEQWEVRYTLTQDDIDAGGVQNSASVAGTTPGGAPAGDVSDDGDDGDGNTTNDPTVAAIPANPSLAVSKTANTPTRIRPGVFMVTFTIAVTNDGNVTQNALQVQDDLTAFVAPATLLTATDPPVLRVTGFGGAVANGGYDGVADIDTLTAPAVLAPGETGTVEIDVVYDITGGSPAGTNVAAVTSDRIPVPVTGSAAVAPVSATTDLKATKTASPSQVRRGESVTFTLTFTNDLPTAEAGLTLVDDLPGGLVYIAGSATYNGGAVPAPVQAGRKLSWPGVNLAPAETVTITLQARVIGGGGSYVNKGYILDPSGARVSNLATATVRVEPEHVFDCSDVIGKVFDDLNHNGYQDQGEPGLPGVRVVTVKGVRITTDDHGRFHVPCAELPSNIGTNFIMKLDTRTLPTGYRLTTENPRVIRLTAGKFAKLNFGASLSNVIDIDLMSRAFISGSDVPKEALVRGVEQLVQQMQAKPSVLRLSYILDKEDRKTAEARLDVVEDLIRKQWKNAGRYKLNIERTIKWVQ